MALNVKNGEQGKAPYFGEYERPFTHQLAVVGTRQFCRCEVVRPGDRPWPLCRVMYRFGAYLLPLVRVCPGNKNVCPIMCIILYSLIG